MAQDSLFAFVLMPFDTAFDDIYRLGIKETATSLGITAERVDEQKYHEGILERIYRQIEAADIIIADMSGKNPNVFYEVGYAHAKQKLRILLTAEADDIPFDLKHQRHVVYKNSIGQLRERLKPELEWAQSEVIKARRSRITVQAKASGGALQKTKYRAEGEVHFKIDFTNESPTPSPEIEAIYFYSTNRWQLVQDAKACPSTDSDVQPFERRHFLTPPIRRLGPKGWAQMKFDSKTTFATAYKGEELKESYEVTGKSLLRIVTANGNFDHEITINTTVDELPF